MLKMDQARYDQWRSRWEQYIINSARNRYCDKETGEEIGWLVTPFLAGFYYGYLATGDTKWVEMLLDWADSWIKRAVKEPDGYRGWPKSGAAGTSVDNLDRFYADSLLGEAMALRPIVLMSNEILRTPALKEKYGAKAVSYIELSEEVFKKWDGRGAWRHTDSGGIITVVAPFGIDGKTGTWTDGYEKRNAPGIGFSHPANKANLVASWLLAMFDATHKPEYKERAEKWFRLMKSRMRPTSSGTYQVWNYWQPAGAWDYKASGIPKHWIGIHPNPAYYDIDVEAIVAAYAHGVVFTKDDISRLVATSLAEKRYWTALVPYDFMSQRRFEDGHKPDSWAGLAATPWYLALQGRSNGSAFFTTQVAGSRAGTSGRDQTLATGFPDAKKTGVPAGVALVPSSSLVINTPEVVLEGLDIQGTVTINANDVTLKNCKVAAASWAVINITSGKTGVVIQDCEINGLSAEGVRGISGQGTFLRNNIHHTEDGIYLTGSDISFTLIQDNYIHDLQSNWSSPHYDGIATDGPVSNITIRHNTIINSHDQTSAVMLSNYFGSVTNVTVDNNWLEGGGYTVYSDGQFNGGTISGVSFTNNYLVKGQYGYKSIRNNTAVWHGNVDGDTGRAIR
jgi:hypothetical protein